MRNVGNYTKALESMKKAGHSFEELSESLKKLKDNKPLPKAKSKYHK